MHDSIKYPHVIGTNRNGDASKKAKRDRRDVLKGKGESVKGMARKEVEWAIAITEERLKALKDVVEGTVGDGTDTGAQTDGTEGTEGILK